MKRVTILPLAARDLRRHRSEAARLLAKIETYARDPVALAKNVKALRGSSAMRLRVGDFRIVFEEAPDEIIVTRIAPRGRVYE